MQTSDAVQRQLRDLHHHLVAEADDMEEADDQGQGPALGAADMEEADDPGPVREVADMEEADMESAFISTWSGITSASVVVADMEEADAVAGVADAEEAEAWRGIISRGGVVADTEEADAWRGIISRGGVVADTEEVELFIVVADDRFYF